MAATKKRPNFLLVVADDLGFSDTGPYGSEIQTPALDRLAKEGIRMTDFHTASACSPTRSMLFSGTDNHIAGLGQMAEATPGIAKRNPGFDGNKSGYEGYLNWKVAAIPEILADAGYFTTMSGKWHLGMTKDHAPCSRGFHRSFTLLPGAGNHHAWEPQLSDDDVKIPVLNNADFYMENDTFLAPENLPKDFFSTRTFTDKLLEQLGGRTKEEKSKPFFAYLAYTAPHWPLQASKESISRYVGKYDDGPDALSKSRLQRLIELGLVPEGVEPAPPVGMIGKPWNELSVEERKISAKKMEVYSAMVDTMDENIGRVLNYLESIQELDNTFVLFMSDNGAEGALLEAFPLFGGGLSVMAAMIAKYYDNSYENIGNADSFTLVGPRWACAATAPSRGFKGWSTEGGIRCPCIIRYPPISSSLNSITHSFTTVMDILPTVLDLAGVPHPGTEFQGREVVTPRGKSWVQHLSSPGFEIPVHGDEGHIHGWELFGNRAIREGNWKAVWLLPPRGRGEWELYNLKDDPAELHDLSDKKPDVLTRLVENWSIYVAETGQQEVLA